MKSLTISLLMKFVSVDMIAKVFALCIAKLLNYAKGKGGDTWKKVKAIAKNAEKWLALFNEVYEDDTLTEEEETKIADAIAEMTTVKKISTILKAQD